MLNSALDGTFSPAMVSVCEYLESYLDTVFFDVCCEEIRVRIALADVLNELGMLGYFVLEYSFSSPCSLEHLLVVVVDVRNITIFFAISFSIFKIY